MKEHSILAACMDDRAAFDQIDPHVRKTDMSVLAWKAYKQIRDWYKRDKRAQHADRKAVLERILLLLPNEKHKQSMREFFDDMPTDSSAVNAAQNLLEIKRANKGAELAAAMFDRPDDMQGLQELTVEYAALLEATTLDRSDVQRGERTARDIVTRKQSHGTVTLYPPRLDRAVDGATMPGHHIVVFGRPNSGKTLLTLNLVAKFLLQGKRVLYIGNEDPQDMIDSRLLSRLARRPVSWVEQNIDTVAPAVDPVLQRYVSVHMNPGTFAEIERELYEHKPDILVLDQIRNLRVQGADGMTKTLEAAAIEARGLAGRHSIVVISVTQAADRRQHVGQELPIWLEQSDVDSSRTGLPAQCDLMIGLGTNDELERRGQRAVSLCRDKLSGRHEKFMVRVDPSRNMILPD